MWLVHELLETDPNCTIMNNILNVISGFPGFPGGFMNPAEQRRAPGTGQYYADYAPITNQGGRSGPNRPPDIPQVPAAMQEYPDYPGNKNNEVVAIL